MSLSSLDPFLEAESGLRLFQSGEQPLDFVLNKVVVAIANHMLTDVSSLYLLDGRRELLVLKATVGLLQSCVGKLRMHLNEGLVGLVAQQRQSLVLAQAHEHPRFKYFPEADEDEYQSFLGVPVVGRKQLFGVLVVQTIEPRSYSAAEVAKLTKIADLLSAKLSKVLV